MNARTLMITVGAVVALAAPGLANARMLPGKHVTKHVVKPVVKLPSKPRPPLYLYYPGPALTTTDQAAASDSSTSSVDMSTTDDSDDC